MDCRLLKRTPKKSSSLEGQQEPKRNLGHLVSKHVQRTPWHVRVRGSGKFLGLIGICLLRGGRAAINCTQENTGSRMESGHAKDMQMQRCKCSLPSLAAGSTLTEVPKEVSQSIPWENPQPSASCFLQKGWQSVTENITFKKFKMGMSFA